jgi:hypothetical protein
MKKKILIAVGVILIIIVAFVAYIMLTTKSHSPAGTAEITVEDLSVKVTYSRPYKKGRVIFGDESTGALQPNGKYWRLGANEATEITFSKDVNFAGKPVAAGSYRMYTVPNTNSWQVSLNSELGEWGAFEPDYSLDVLKVDVAAQAKTPETEQFTIQLASDSTGIQMDFVWDKTMVRVPIAQQ